MEVQVLSWAFWASAAAGGGGAGAGSTYPPAMTTCYVTTPIYYVNDRPHIGHCYTTLVADVYARFQRLAGGADVFMLTGTDEHADKVVTSAAAHGTTPQEWADRNSEEFRRAFALMGVAYDDFIRTTEPRHKAKVTEYIAALMKTGDIYRGEYTGWYDEGQEEYLTETAAKEANFHSPINKRPLVKRTEPCYFFRLSKYRDRLLGLIADDAGFVRPGARRQEVLGRLRQGLNDVPVSRPVTDDPATQWGVRIPGDEAHRVYVWIDALFNYLSVVDTPERRRLWPARVHFLGKDILWFHAVIWPALLLALGKELPGTIYGHGWWISEGEKMSKSMGNFIDLERLRAYTERFGLDALRWYLATQGPLGGGDADFSHVKFVETFNADLANGIGNATSRVGNMIDKYFGGVLPADDGVELVPDAASGFEGTGVRSTFEWKGLCAAGADRVRACLETQDLEAALRAGTGLASRVDLLINVTRPFTIAKRADAEAKRQLGAILYQCAEALRVASVLLSPALTTGMPKLWKPWGCEPRAGAGIGELCAFGGEHALRPGQRITKGEILYMRADAAAAFPAAGA